MLSHLAQPTSYLALKVPLGALPVIGRGKGGYARNARVQSLGNAFDHTALTSGISAFKKYHHFVPLCTTQSCNLTSSPCRRKSS